MKSDAGNVTVTLSNLKVILEAEQKKNQPCMGWKFKSKTYLQLYDLNSTCKKEAAVKSSPANV